MKFLLATLFLMACATTPAANDPRASEEMDSCPSSMSREQHQYGVDRCRAMCARYQRKYADYDSQCRCRCQPDEEMRAQNAQPR